MYEMFWLLFRQRIQRYFLKFIQMIDKKFKGKQFLFP